MGSLPTMSTTETNTTFGVVELQQLDIDHDDVVNQTDMIKRSSDHMVLNTPDPPTMLQELLSSVKQTIFPHKPNNSTNKKHSSSSPSRRLSNSSSFRRLALFFQELFPILRWGRHYKLSKFKNDLMSGLTLASLSIPQVTSIYSTPQTHILYLY